MIAGLQNVQSVLIDFASRDAKVGPDFQQHLATAMRAQTHDSGDEQLKALGALRARASEALLR